MRTHRADVERQDEDDEEGEVPGGEHGDRDDDVLSVAVSVPPEQTARQQEDGDHLRDEECGRHCDCLLVLVLVLLLR